MGETPQVATRLAVAALLHESNAFVPALTPIEAFVRLDGALLEAMARGSGTEVDGALARAEAEGAEAVLTTAAFAPSSGPVESAAADQLVDELVAGITAAHHGAPLDAVVVCLHGSMASPGTPDVEGRVLGELRRRLGPGVALVATLDWHCSITPAMADAADALVAYRTYPHIDQYERGAEAAGLALRLCRGTEAHAALVRPPMLVAGPGTRHEEPPMAEVLAAARDAAGADRRILAWSVCPGFARSDDPASGVAVYVAATDPGAAGALAVRLAEMMWDRRALFRPQALEPAE